MHAQNISNFYDPQISSPAKNSMNLPGFYAGLVSSAQTKHRLHSSPMYREHVQRKFECIGLFAWVLYSFNFTLTLLLPYGNHRRKWVK